MTIRVLIADDHTLVRKGFRALLEKEPDMVTVGEADSGLAALQQARECRPDVVLMDITMPGMNGIEATRALLAEFPDIRVIALSMHSDRRMVVDALSAGADAYILKECAFRDLAASIRAVKEGNTPAGVRLSGILLTDRHESLDPVPAATLSARERQVLQLIAEGNNTKEIAFLLELSVKTVETHRQNIMDKLGINNIAGLTKFAVREGLTSL
ncbi:response regulator transcription factor [Geobacter sp. DSM 9736]|uniref:response regulator n=1 Tax=Geobacter sp. DSM 9736 TaxID=1277350 RepID=UPI000B50870A|nr:response regulator transcription factor [Geobacter sp. DSM 9736]SNB46537.1 two component transcriptional regulator, LuxR family [Geobacter sp. DSM 9736]